MDATNICFSCCFKVISLGDFLAISTRIRSRQLNVPILQLNALQVSHGMVPMVPRFWPRSLSIWHVPARISLGKRIELWADIKKQPCPSGSAKSSSGLPLFRRKINFHFQKLVSKITLEMLLCNPDIVTLYRPYLVLKQGLQVFELAPVVSSRSGSHLSLRVGVGEFSEGEMSWDL